MTTACKMPTDKYKNNVRKKPQPWLKKNFIAGELAVADVIFISNEMRKSSGRLIDITGENAF